MTEVPTGAVTPAGGPDVSVEALVARSTDLKAELLAYARGPRFRTRLEAQIREAAGPAGGLDEHTAVWATDHFLVQYPLRDGRTVVEQFAERRRPSLPRDERAMLLGWRDVVEGCFEVVGRDGAVVEMLNLIDDRRYTVHSNAGIAATRHLRKGTFAVARIVPVHPDLDAWLFSGTQASFPKAHGPQLAEVALQTVTGNPRLLRRNPDMVRRGWEMQADDRSDFVAHFGSDVAVLAPGAAQEELRAHYRRRVEKAAARRGGRSRRTGPRTDPDALGRMPEDLMSAESVGLIYDEVEGLNFYRDFGRLDELFADPSLATDRRYGAQLRSYLQDESVSPLAIRRLVQRHPDGVDPVFRKALGKPRFSWDRDGERMLRRRKKQFFLDEPMPSVSVLGERLVELLK